MIEKMDKNIDISQEPMVFMVESESVESIEDEYASFSWLDKLVIFLKGLFLQKDKLELTKNVIIDRLVRQICSVSPDLFDMKHRSVLGRVCEMVKNLQESLETVRSPLSVCFGMDRVLFYSIMGQLEFPPTV